MAISSVIPPKVSDLHTANRRGWKLWLNQNAIYPKMALALCVLAITGCGVSRQVSVTPGNRVPATTPSEPSTQAAPSFKMSVQTASPVKAPLPAPSGAIGVGYSSEATVAVELASSGFIGTVNVSLSGLPAGVTLASPVSPVLLNVGGGAANQAIPVELYVSPGTLPGSYQFSVIGTPSANSNSLTPVQIPVTLTVTSGASAAWKE